MYAIGYIRVSTQGQVDLGVSLEAQKAKIEAWCQANDYILRDTFIDAGISGAAKAIRKREGLQMALATVSKDMALVSYSMSRLSRSTKDMLTIADLLESKGADLVSLTEKIDTTSAAGKMVFRMLAVLVEFERDLISERTKAALSYKKGRQERVGSVPYGYRVAKDGNSLIPNKTEQQVLTLVAKLKTEGLSLRLIAEQLELSGYKPRGKKWHPQTVARIAELAAA